jgi:hypothetical protein
MQIAMLRGYTSCFVVVSCLLVLYSIMQFENLSLQQGSHARMQFDILQLQQGSSAHSCMQFGMLPLHYSDCRTLVCSLRTCRCRREAWYAYMQFEKLPLRLQLGSPNV